MTTNNSTPAKLPTLNDIIKSDNYENNALMVLLNQEPPAKWVKAHPFATCKDAAGKVVPIRYLPRERVEYLLSRIFTKWWVEILNVTLIANSPTVTVRLYVVDPVTGETSHQDGIGAAPIQTNSGAGAIDFNQMKTGSIQMAAPAAETYAIKDAAEKFGKLFGKDLNVATEISYDALLKTPIDVDELRELYALKEEALTEDEKIHAERILNTLETASYKKLHAILTSK